MSLEEVLEKSEDKTEEIVEEPSPKTRKPHRIRSGGERPLIAVLFPRLYGLIQRLRRRPLFTRNRSRLETKITEIRRTEKGYSILETRV